MYANEVALFFALIVGCIAFCWEKFEWQIENVSMFSEGNSKHAFNLIHIEIRTFNLPSDI
jgi:hypothetical protein